MCALKRGNGTPAPFSFLHCFSATRWAGEQLCFTMLYFLATNPNAMEPIDHGPKPLKLWAKITFSLLNWLSNTFVTVMKANTSINLPCFLSFYFYLMVLEFLFLGFPNMHQIISSRCNFLSLKYIYINYWIFLLKVNIAILFLFFYLFIFAVLGLELRAFTVNHSTSPILWRVFQDRVSWIFVRLALNCYPPDLCLLSS
jgi:hypothetical protein